MTTALTFLRRWYNIFFNIFRTVMIIQKSFQFYVINGCFVNFHWILLFYSILGFFNVYRKKMPSSAFKPFLLFSIIGVWFPQIVEEWEEKIDNEKKMKRSLHFQFMVLCRKKSKNLLDKSFFFLETLIYHYFGKLFWAKYLLRPNMLVWN